MERINHLELLGEKFIQPEDFDPDARLEEAFSIIYDEPIEVEIRFSAAVAKYVRERSWTKVQKMTDLTDGSMLFEMNTSGWYDVKKWVLSFGTEAELLRPVEMRAELVEVAKGYAKIYGTGVVSSESV